MQESNIWLLARKEVGEVGLGSRHKFVEVESKVVARQNRNKADVRNIISSKKSSSCFFRSSTFPPNRKALLQITERCNLHCAHCFISAGNCGDSISKETVRDILIPQLKRCLVSRITLTGGEPFMHPDIVEIIYFLRKAGMHVGICTNGTKISAIQMDTIASMGNVHLNVSLDGFRKTSHGMFRGDLDSFATTIKTICDLGERRLLQGLLVTPNNFAEVNEYAEICSFARENGAKYVLLNPLSSFGRGMRAKKRLASPKKMMKEIMEITNNFDGCLQVIHIRFPNDHFPLGSCEAGRIIYIFVHGDVAACPYLVFAARTLNSRHKPEEFIIGNILRNDGLADRLARFDLNQLYRPRDNLTCKSCLFIQECGKGCPAAIIASGQEIGGIDYEVCPVANISEETNIA